MWLFTRRNKQFPRHSEQVDDTLGDNGSSFGLREFLLCLIAPPACYILFSYLYFQRKFYWFDKVGSELKFKRLFPEIMSYKFPYLFYYFFGCVFFILLSRVIFLFCREWDERYAFGDFWRNLSKAIAVSVGISLILAFVIRQIAT